MTNPNEPPKMMTLEEMEKALQAAEKKKKPPVKSKARKKKSAPPKQPSVAKDASPPVGVPVEACFMDIHFWLREGDLFGTVCNDARDEKNFRGPGVMIFAHDHLRNQDCTKNCKEIK